jgi:hypothetical protein
MARRKIRQAKPKLNYSTGGAAAPESTYGRAKRKNSTLYADSNRILARGRRRRKSGGNDGNMERHYF